MKKIIIVIALALLLVQCESDVATVSDNNAQAVLKAEAGQKWPLKISKSLLSQNGNFATVNADVISGEDTWYYYVDLSAQTSVDTMAVWLKDNSAFIDYEASYEAIEETHKINLDDYPFIDSIPATSFRVITLTELQGQVATAGGSFSNHYQYFLKFNVSVNSVSVGIHKYVQDGTCYSIPLFKSILSNHGLTSGNTEFEFVSTVIDNQNTVIFRVKNLDGKFMYYDFSNNPPIR